MHDCGVAHNDVKSTNFKTRQSDDGSETLILLDYGLAVNLNGMNA